MSGLILQGDTIENFGRHLPVPQIEKIEIFSSSFEDALEFVKERYGWDDERALEYFGEEEGSREMASDPDDVILESGEGIDSGDSRGLYVVAETKLIRVKVHLSLMLNTSTNFLSDEYVQFLRNNLHVNFLLLNDTVRIEKLKETKKTILSEFNWSIIMGSLTENWETRPLTDYTIPTEWTVQRDASGNQFIQMSDITMEFLMTEDRFRENATVFAATSTMDPELGYFYQNNAVAFALNFSDIAYEDVMKDGKLAHRSNEGYYDLTGAFYTGRPIMGLNDRYHKTETFGFNEVIDGIRSITAEYKGYQQANKNLNAAIENIEYIIARYGHTPQILKQLHKLSLVFPGAANSTRVGRLYTRFSLAISNANTSIIEQPEVQKRLIRNVKIQDYRPFQYIADYEGSYNADLDPGDLAYDVILQTNIAKYLEKSEGSTDAEAPYTPETAKQATKDAVIGALLAMPNWNPKSSDVYIPMRSMYANIVSEFLWDCKAKLEEMNNWIDRTVTIRTPDDGLQVWSPNRDRWDNEATWEGVHGAVMGDKDTYDQMVNSSPYRSAVIWFGGPKTDSQPETRDKCTVEMGFYHNGCALTNSNDTEDGPYKCFTPLFQFSNIARCLGSQSVYGAATDAGHTELVTGRIFHYDSISHGAKEKDGWEGLSRRFPRDWQKDLWSPIEVLEHTQEVLGIETDGTSGGWDVQEWPDFKEGADRATQVDKGRFSTHWDDELYEFSYVKAMCRVVQKAIKDLFGIRTGDGAKIRGGMLKAACQTEASWNALVARIEATTPYHSIYNEDGSVNETAIDLWAHQEAGQIKMDVLTYWDEWTSGDSGDDRDESGRRATWRRDSKLMMRWCPSWGIEDNPGDMWNRQPNMATQAYASATKPVALTSTTYDRSGDTFMDYLHWDGANAGMMFDALYADYPAHSMPYMGEIGTTELDINSRIKESLRDYLNDVWEAEIVRALKTACTALAAFWGVSYDNGEWRKLANVDILVQKNGWLFFDMEKFITQQSEISKFLPPSRMQEYLEYGRDLLNYYIRPRSFKVTTNTAAELEFGFGTMSDKRYQSEVILEQKYDSAATLMPENTLPYIASNTFEAPPPQIGGVVPRARINAIDAAGWEDFKANQEGEIIVDGELAEKVTVNSYLMLRNFDFPWDDIPDNYRLMAYNYNYFVDDDETISQTAGFTDDGIKDGYIVTVEITDWSRRILVEFQEIIESVLEELQAYLEEAQANCAFNEFDDEFNTFFKDQMMLRYEEDPKSAPWIRGPLFYVIFRDLFENAYGGDSYAVLEEARKLMDSINPQTGWLTALQEFVGLYEDLLTAYEDHIREALSEVIDGEYARDCDPTIHTVEFTTDRFRVPVIDYVNDTGGDFPSEIEPE